MNFNDFSTLLINKFSFNPTDDQKKAIISISHFLISENNTSLFILKGYAGTGKTTLMKTLVDNVKILNYNVCLLAPTGRAAKILSTIQIKNLILFIKKFIFPLLISLVSFKQN